MFFAGIGFFAVVLGFVNALIAFGKYTYASNPILYICIYGLGAIVLFGLFPGVFTEHLSSVLGLVTLTAAVVVTVLLGRVYRLCVTPNNTRWYSTIPTPEIVQTSLTEVNVLVKVIEIVFQQLCALLILVGLFQISSFSLSAIMILFALVVMGVHLPSPKFFGWFYGGFFLVVATFIALGIPWLYVVLPYAFYIVTVIHIMTYWVLYTWVATPAFRYDKMSAL